MIRLTHRSIPAGYRFFYHLVFCPQCEGMITRFCHACEGGLLLPHDAEPGAEFSLMAVDCLYRTVFVEIDHEPIKDANGNVTDDQRVVVKAILKRTRALARAPHLAELKPPTNVPAAKELSIIGQPRKLANGGVLARAKSTLEAEPDDIPF
jgi:hypothetical protein